MKKFISILLSLTVLLSVASFHAMAAEEISVYVNGEKVVFDQQPVIQNSRTLVPMRAIVEKMQAEVEWAENTRTVHCTRDDTRVDLKIGSDVVTVNYQISRLDITPKIIGGRTMIPLRFIGEAFGADVQWDGATRSAYITIAPRKTPLQPKFDTVVTPSAVSASACDQGSTAENAVDGDIATRWAADCGEVNQYLEFDLGAEKSVFGIGLAWYMGGGRAYYFTVSVSNDGENFTDVIANGASSGKTEDVENHAFTETKARYIRVTGKGNVKNTFAHITEARIYGPEGSAATEVKDSAAEAAKKEEEEKKLVTAPTTEKFELASASATDGNSSAMYAIDGDNATKWSADCSKKAQSITVDIGKEKLVDTIGIRWYKGNMYTYTYRVEVSSDGENFKEVSSGVSKAVNDMQYATLGGDRARYVRITVSGSKGISAAMDSGNQCHISEINIY